MTMDKEYEVELNKAREEYKDLLERGDEAVGNEDEWAELEREFFTEEEIRESHLKAQMLGEELRAKQERKNTLRKFEEKPIRKGRKPVGVSKC